MKTVAIDLRCLNYPLLTGVNTYTLHFLYQFYLQKQKKKTILVGIGLSSDRLDALSIEFPFFGQMWDEQISLSDYLNFNIFDYKLNFPIKITNFFLALKFRFLKKTRGSYRKFDLLFLPQPRSLPADLITEKVTIFHDLYGALQPSSLNWRQRIFDNLSLYKVIADDSEIIWVNSISTGLDVQNFLNQDKNKIKLVYPALPEWDILRGEL